MAGVTFLLVLAHLGVAVGWLGSMLYSLFVVQPALARAVPEPVRVEDIYRELGAGNRWKVVGLIAALAVTGVALVIVGSGHSAAWWVLDRGEDRAAGRGVGAVLVGVLAGLAAPRVRAAGRDRR